MTALIIVGVVVVVIVVLGLLLWAGSWAVDSTIKEYIDYAKKGKDHGGS